MIESIGAGYIIGVMAHFYGRCNYPIIGAVLFGLGLLTVWFAGSRFCPNCGKTMIKAEDDK